MEQIKYRKTLDVHKNGVQFLLTGFQTGDVLSRVVEISLMSSGDAIDFPLDKLIARMYVTQPESETQPFECEIVDNKVVFEVPRISKEGITEMQLKLIETSVEGAVSVIVSPKFAVEVAKSDTGEESAEKTKDFYALERAVAKAKTVYDERFLRMELTNDCIFKAYYADGTTYETDILKRLFHDGNVALAESYAHGGTGTRVGEDTDNAMYYSNVSKSAAEEAKNSEEKSGELLEETKLHSIYTAFSIDFDTGEMEYISPSFNFKIDGETGELIAEGKALFDDEIGGIVTEFLERNGVDITKLFGVASDHEIRLSSLEVSAARHDSDIKGLQDGEALLSNEIFAMQTETIPIARGGTDASTIPEAIANLGLDRVCMMDIRPYTGDGNFGENKKNSLTFNIKPRFVFIWAVESQRGGLFAFSSTSDLYTCISSSGSFEEHRCKIEGNNMEWYSSEASFQANVNGTKYIALALGFEK